MKFSGKVVNGPVNECLNIGGDPDHDPYCDTGNTCFGGGMHCAIASNRGFCCTACCTTNPQLIGQVEFGVQQLLYCTVCLGGAASWHNAGCVD